MAVQKSDTCKVKQERPVSMLFAMAFFLFDFAPAGILTTLEININHLTDFILGQIQDQRLVIEASDITHHGDLFSKIFTNLGFHSSQLFKRRNVTLVRLDVRVSRLKGDNIDTGDVCSLFSQFLTHTLCDSSGTSCDEDELVGPSGFGEFLWTDETVAPAVA